MRHATPTSPDSRPAVSASRHETGRPFSLLFVCTGNICRSALAERYVRAYLAEHLGADSGAVVVASAGTRAVIGSAMHPHSATVLHGLGGDPTDFRARKLAPVMADRADLVLAMTRDHRRAVLAMSPGALPRTFTLLEAADVVALVGPGLDLAGERFADRCRALVKTMSRSRSRRPAGRPDEVLDPVGRPLDVHEEVGDLISASLDPLLARLVSLRGAPAGHTAGTLLAEQDTPATDATCVTAHRGPSAS